MQIYTDTLNLLIAATREAYTLLVDGNDTDEVYARLTRTYEDHGIGADTSIAESSVDWYEGGILVDALTEALDGI